MDKALLRQLRSELEAMPLASWTVKLFWYHGDLMQFEPKFLGVTRTGAMVEVYRTRHSDAVGFIDHSLYWLVVDDMRVDWSDRLTKMIYFRLYRLLNVKGLLRQRDLAKKESDRAEEARDRIKDRDILRKF